MKLTLGFSTCPNDTFIFDAIVNKKIDTQGLEFDYILADVEELNHLAFQGKIQITKVSFHAYAFVADKYKILSAGSALGKNNGPLIISKNFFDPRLLPQKKVAIPGKYTTANLLLHIFFPDVKDTKEYLFSQIEDAILTDQVDAGVIIHETRFTYQTKGLIKIADLGQLWEQTTNLPVPLGGIIIHRSIPADVQKLFDQVLKQSIQHAWQNPDSPYEFMKKYAQEITPDVMYKHIHLYVNDFTLDLTDLGRQAILELYRLAAKTHLIPQIEDNIFVN